MEEPRSVGNKSDLRNFGFSPSSDSLDDLFTEYLKMPTRDSITNQMLSLEKYDLSMGYQKGDGTDNPIALVMMHRERDIYSDSEWERTLKVLAKLKLHNVTGLNIMQQLELPRPILKMLIRIADEVNANDANVIADIEKKMQQAGIHNAEKQ